MSGSSKERGHGDLLRSLEFLHPESLALSQQGMAEWVAALSPNDEEPLINEAVGKRVRWVAGTGWVAHLTRL